MVYELLLVGIIVQGALGTPPVTVLCSDTVRFSVLTPRVIRAEVRCVSRTCT